MRSGKLIGRIGYSQKLNNEDENLILQKILEEHYMNVEPVEIPSEILIQCNLPKQKTLEDWLTHLRKNKVKIITALTIENKNDIKEKGIQYLATSGNFSNLKSLKAGDISIGDTGVRKSMQRILLNIEPEGQLDFDLYMKYNYNNADTPQPTSINITETTGAAYFGNSSSSLINGIFPLAFEFI